MKIGVVGSINVDLVSYLTDFPKVGETISSNNFLLNYGGKGANQSIAVSKTANAPCILFAKVGDDAHANAVINEIALTGVNTSYITKSSFPTGNALILVSQKQKNNKIIINKLSNGDYHSKDLELFKDFLKKINFVVFQNEICSIFTEKALKLAKKMEKTTFLNPSPLKGFNQKWLKYVDYLIVNEIELELLSSKKIENNLDEISKELLNRFKLKDIIITLGSKGAYLANSQYLVQPYKVNNIVDVTGAGDTFVGTLAGLMHKGMSIKKAAKKASKAAAICITRKGAQKSIPFYGEL